MAYLLVTVATIMISFVGTLVKVASPMVPASALTLSRFFFGVVFLLLVCLIMRHRPRLYFRSKWIWAAVVFKCMNYFFENAALHHGSSYGNIIVFPIQAVSFCFFAAYFFKEKIGPRKILATTFCITGILIVSMNGVSLSAFFNSSLKTLLLFIFAAIGAAGFVLSQKMLIDTVDAKDMNISVFLVCTLISLVPVFIERREFHAFRTGSFLALVGLGAITGIAFLLIAYSLKHMSLVVSGMIQSSSTLFTLLWAILFWHEAVTGWIILGAAVFLCGLALINIAPKKGVFVN